MLTLEDLKRSNAAHRKDSYPARQARMAVTLALTSADDPEKALARARADLEAAGRAVALEHLGEIEARARAGEPGLTARENGAREADRARPLVRR